MMALDCSVLMIDLKMCLLERSNYDFLFNISLSQTGGGHSTEICIINT